MDKVSFHYEESVLKYNYVYHKIFFLENELPEEALKCKEIIEVLQDAKVMKTIAGLSPFYPQLVKEFIMNILEEFNKAGRKDYRKVCVRDCNIGFYFVVINESLG